MANREKGEVSVDIGGKTYTLLVNMHAWALAQDALTKGDAVPGLDMLSKRLSSGHMLSIIAVFWAALQQYHADEVLTIRHATTLLEKSEGKAAEALVKAVNQSGADKADLRELGVEGNPTKARSEKRANGVGETSTSTPAASV